MWLEMGKGDEVERLRAENSRLRQMLDDAWAAAADKATVAAESSAMAADLIHRHEKLLQRYEELGDEAAKVHEAYKRVVSQGVDGLPSA